MPKKIIERTVIDEDDSIEGSEHEYHSEPEIKPQPKTKSKTKTKPKKERNEEEEKQVEENKKKRVENATKARLAKLEEDKINNAVKQRLADEKRKIKEHQELQKNFELSVESVVDRLMKAKYQTRKGKTITDTETASDFEVKPKKQYVPKAKPIKQKEEHDYPSQQQPTPQQYPNNESFNNFRNLFM
jgi:hypothetical protein